jgi:N-acetylmuramoyl-L-alanine amidase
MTRALPVRRVLGLGVKTIMIDAGHGGKATGTTGREGTHEKDITLDIARRLRQRLDSNTQYRILVTRDTDRDCSLRERVELANTQKADLFISIHVNSLPQHSVNIVETYFFGPTTDRDTLRLAAAENQDSDYAISDFDAVVGRIANRLKFEESSRMAHVVHQSIFSGMRAQNPSLRDCGVKRAPFVILLGVDMPGILVEVSCMSNREEERKLLDPGYRERIAGFIEQGIINYLNQRSGS